MYVRFEVEGGIGGGDRDGGAWRAYVVDALL